MLAHAGRQRPDRNPRPGLRVKHPGNFKRPPPPTLLAAGCRLHAAACCPRQGVPPALCLDSGVLSIPNLSQSSRCMDPSFIPDDHMLKRVQTPKPQISLTPPSLSVRSESPTMKRAINPGGGYVTIPGKSPGQRQRAAQERGHCKFSGRAGERLR